MKSSQSLPDGWSDCPLSSVLKEIDIRVADLPPDEARSLDVLSLTKRAGLVPQNKRFKKRVATENVDSYKVVRFGWIVYNPYVIWEGAIHALRRDTPGIVSPVYPVWERTEPDYGYLDYLLRTPELIAKYEKLSAGAVNRRRSIKRDDFLKIRISLPPLLEQRKIATVLSQVQQAIEQQERLIALTTELKKSLMHKLFTEGLRGERQKQTEIGPVPKSWDLHPLKDLLREPVRNGHSAKATSDKNGIRTLTLTAVTQREFSGANTKMTSADERRVSNLWLVPGDILVERANTPEYVGLAALYEGPEHYAIYPDLMMRIRVKNERIMPYFLAEFLVTSPCRAYFQRNARSTAGNFPKIDQGTVEKVLVPVPTPDEQKDIVAALRTAQRKRDLHIGRSAALTSLFRTLLHQLMTAQIRVHDLDLSFLEQEAKAS